MGTVRRPVLDRPTAMRLAATEYERFVAALRRLGPDDWCTPTNCPGWDVKAMAGHILGMARMAAFPKEGLRQPALARKRGGVFIDALTDIQVRDAAALSPEQLTASLAEVGPKAARGRARIPAPLRRIVLPASFTDCQDPWTVGYLFDVILTRDPWMHRMDIARATGREPELTPDHDGVLVADAVRDWAGRHGEPCTVTLDGPAGGSWTFGKDGPSIELGAVDFCRTVAGRGGETTGLLATPVPF